MVLSQVFVIISNYSNLFDIDSKIFLCSVNNTCLWVFFGQLIYSNSDSYVIFIQNKITCCDAALNSSHFQETYSLAEVFFLVFLVFWPATKSDVTADQVNKRSLFCYFFLAFFLTFFSCYCGHHYLGVGISSHQSNTNLCG